MTRIAGFSWMMIAAAGAAFGQYKTEDTGSADAAAAFKPVLEAKGVKILDAAGKIYCEIWLRAALPPAIKSTEQNITLPEIPPGAVLGVISFPAASSDRRGQLIKPGVYTLRYGQFPITGDHQGVAPQRDFVVLSRIADDADPAAMPVFDALMAMSRKGSGTTHALIMSIWKTDSFAPGLAKEGEHDWVLQRKLGAIPLSIILIGKSEG